MRTQYLFPGPCIRTLLALCLSGIVSPLFAADISAYAFNSGMNCQGVWPLPDTGQTVSYTATFGEDHDYQPAAAQMSYTILNPVGISSVTVDNVTGLMWVTNPMTDAGFKGPQTWESALTSCTVTLNGMAYAGYTNWRLPNVRELTSIVKYGATTAPRINTTAFPNTKTESYWTSTSISSTLAWPVYFGYSYSIDFNRSIEDYQWKVMSHYVRCVRGGPY